ncbi:MAG: TonB-dependent receptor, partial [Rhizorhabdus sp.]|nr:TonB-dependent receptor [Rhizorhabdus sp.]
MDADVAHALTMRRPPLLFVALMPIASMAQAEGGAMLDLPAGPLANAVAALGRQSGISVSVADAALWQRPVPAVKGRMSVAMALKRMLGDRAVATQLGPQSWRITAVAPLRAVPQPRPVVQAEDVAPEGPPIVVTASKRDIRLRDYPGTVSLMGGADLAFGGERGTEAILSRLATVSSTHLGAGRNKLFIRGIADSSFTGPTQATVGQYLGDMRLSYNAPDPDLRLYDIASVEVLEGPQGTLYGAGSLGGIIRIVRNAPRLDRVEAALSTGVSAIQHGDPGGDIGGTINLPIADGRLAARFVAYGITEGGYIDDPTRGRHDINRTTIAGGRAMLRFAPGDGWTIDIGATVQKTHGDDSQYADRNAPRLTRNSAIDQGFGAGYRLGEVVIAKDWDDGLHFLSSTGIVGQRLSERYDATEPEGELRLFRQRNRTRMISSENRLWRPMEDGFGWVLGGSFVRNSTRLSRALGPIDAPEPVTGVTNRIVEGTLYGEASYMPIKGLIATAGARVTHARLSGGGEDVVPSFVPLVQLARAQQTAKRRETTALPSMALSAAILPDLVAFARYQEGFRPGGLAIESDFVRRFRNDHVGTLETGMRYGAPGRGVFDLSISLSHTRWRDIQADFIDGSGLPSTDNIGDGRIYSLAAAAGWRPLPGLGFDLAFALNDSKVTNPSAAVRQVYALEAAISDTALTIGRVSQIPNVARYAGRAGVDYRTALSDAIDLHVAASARYVGRSRLGIGPKLGEVQGDYLDTQLTARIGWSRFGVS